MPQPTSLLPYIQVQTQPEPEWAIIWLHGLGADGHDFESIVPELGLEDYKIRFVFPHAPLRRVTVNQGFEMRAWYDILNMDLGRQIDTAQIEISRLQIEELIEEQVQKGIPSERIFLAGFSQGGAVILMNMLKSKRTLAGYIALSTYLGDESALEFLSVKTPVLMCHGSYDPVVTYELGKESFKKMRASGAQIEWQEYPMPHSLCAEEVECISDFIQKRMKEIRGV